MDLDELFEKGLLRKIESSKERALKSLEAGDKYLAESKKALGAKAYGLAFIGAYNSAFHYARAILFLQGVGERSHFAVSQYLHIKCKELGQELDTLDLYRSMRHSAQYGLGTEVSERDVKEAIKFASEFGIKIKKKIEED